MDATIGEGLPDLKVKNETGSTFQIGLSFDDVNITGNFLPVKGNQCISAAWGRVVYETIQKLGGGVSQKMTMELHRRGFILSDEYNFAFPRLTGLKEAGLVETAGKKICEKAGRSVTIWTVKML